jgi:hypothetical protein
MLRYVFFFNCEKGQRGASDWIRHNKTLKPGSENDFPSKYFYLDDPDIRRQLKFIYKEFGFGIETNPNVKDKKKQQSSCESFKTCCSGRSWISWKNVIRAKRESKVLPIEKPKELGYPALREQGVPEGEYVSPREPVKSSLESFPFSAKKKTLFSRFIGFFSQSKRKMSQ